KEIYDKTPEQIIDLKGLMGDKSDNIPGIPGVGEKTALKLLHQFGTVENVLGNADSVSGKKLQEKLKEFTEEALMSKSLATIHRAVPLGFKLEDLEFKKDTEERKYEMFEEHEFKLEDLEFKNDTEEQKYELFKEYEFNSLLENMDAAETEDISDFDVENTENLQGLGNKISIHLEVHADNYLYNKPEFIAVTDG